MTNILKNFQNKPEHARRFIMWFCVISIMTAIFIFWIFTFPSSVPASENNEINPDLSKLPSIWQSLKDQINNLKNLWAIRLR